MNCKMALSRLSAFQDGELSLPQSRELERHLKKCASCRSEWAACQDLLGNLCRLTTPVPAPDFSSRVMAGLPTPPEKKFGWLPSLVYTLACLAIFISIFLLEISANGQPATVRQPATTFSAVLAESRDLGLLAVHDSTLDLFSGDDYEK
jgi:predicted anti-sigma-YlaC factor YlaD